MNTNIPDNNLVKMKHQRVRYFAGQFLEDKDLAIEQQYHLLRRRRLNKQQFTPGIREGFVVEAVAPDLKNLRIGTGFAIDVDGRELWLDEEHVLTPEKLSTGNYFLYMLATEIAEGYTTYTLPDDAARKKNVTSSWEGETRFTDAIRFSLVRADQAGGVDRASIRLASIKCEDGIFRTVDSKDRTVSTTLLGGGLTINSSSHRGESNAYIGVSDVVTFSSGAKRMDFNGDAPLYMFNKGGVVIASERSGGDTRAGGLHVQGMTYAQGGLRVIQGNKDQGTRQVLAIAGTTITSVESNFGVTIDSGEGKLSLKGASTLYITNKSGVVIAKDGDASGTLHVKGKAHLEGGLEVTHTVEIQGPLKVRDEIKFAGAELKTRDGNSGVIFDSYENDLYLHGQKTLYISNKNGVVIAKDGADGAGTLTVKGKAHLQGGLDVMQDVDINGSLTVRNGALKADKELIVPGAKFTSHGGAMKLESTMMADETNRHRMHISGDWLFLLQKEKVVIGQYGPPWNSSGKLEVHGESTFNDLVVHSPKARNLSGLNEMAKKLKNDGDFLFFGEESGPSSQEQFFILWKTSKGVKVRALNHDAAHIKIIDVK